MTSRRLPAVPLLVTVAAMGVAQESPRQPYHDPKNAPRAYNGPGREQPDPEYLQEVRIGYFGAPDGGHPDGGSLWQGVQLATEEANAAGGYRNLPFRLLPAWSGSPWTGGVTQLVKLVYSEKVWAVIGGMDGATTHLAEQVTTKALLPLVNPAAGDRSIHTAYVPWIFSCVPGDHRQAAVLRQVIKASAQPFTIVSATDHDSRAFLSQLNLSPAFHVEFDAGSPRLEEKARHAAGVSAGTLLLIAGPRDSARMVKALRRAGFAGTIAATSAMARSSALSEAGPSSEGVFVPLFVDETPAAARFQAVFRKRWAAEPDWAALQAYDTANLLFAAIRAAGLNRARIRDTLQEMSPWPGTGGPIHWDDLGQNDRLVRLGIIRRGKVVPAHPVSESLP